MSQFTRQIVRQSYFFQAVTYVTGALPAAGAYTSSLPFVFPQARENIRPKEIVLWCSYVQGAAGGQAKLRISFINTLTSTPTSFGEVVIDQTLAVAQPYDDQSIYVQEVKLPVPSSGAALSFAVPVKVPPGMSGVQVLAAEIGVVGTPGTLRIDITGGY